MNNTDTVRDIRQQPFYWIDRHFLTEYASRIGPLGIAVYNALVYRSDRAGRAFPGLADLSDLTGIKSKTTLRRVLASLAAAKLIKINTRFDGQRYETNEYFILPVGQEVTQVGQEMTHPGTANDPPRSLDVPPLVQEMTHPGTANDTDLQSVNYNHDNNNHSTTSSSSMNALPAAAADLLESAFIEPEKLNGQALDMAAWLAYVKTQPRLKNPVGYARARIKAGEHPPLIFLEIVKIELDWETIMKTAPLEEYERREPGMVERLYGLDKLYYEMESVSTEAVKILAKIADEASNERQR